jgi:hypothetical protein
MRTEPAKVDVGNSDFVETTAGSVDREHQDLATAARPTETPKRDPAVFILLPLLFLLVTLLGGMRLAPDNTFAFLKPELICLVLAAVSLLIFVRFGLVRLNDWVSHDFASTKNVAASAVLITLFTATVQVFNSLLPEHGLAFFVVGFCFFWTLTNNLFSSFDVRKLMRSFGVLFGMAFVVKYLILANVAAPSSRSWLGRVMENPAQEAFTWFLDLPRFGPGTGYIQFFTIAIYLLALYLTPTSLRK